MIHPSEFLDQCLERGFTFFTGTPCSYLKPLINYAIDHERFQFVDATNEGDAVAIASGVTVAGGRSVVMFQNSGLGNAVNPLTSLAHIFRIPLLILVTHRGEPGGDHDEPQHGLMGEITGALLSTMKIGWSHFPQEPGEIRSSLDKAGEFLRVERRPYAFVVRKNDVEPYKLQTPRSEGSLSFDCSVREHFKAARSRRSTRSEALKAIQEVVGKESVLVGTTGYTGRELYQLEDRENQFYMVGSMGCALPFGLGIALQKPSVRVVVIDGDGALLMRTGTMATVGARAPQNLLHVLLDNEAHDSTGGQQTVSRSVSFSAVARGFGYPRVFSTDDLVEFCTILADACSEPGPTFIRFKICCGAMENLKRPEVTPVQVRQRFAHHLSLS